MPSDYSRPHLDIGLRKEITAYTSPNRGGGANAERVAREQHGARVQAEFNAALAIMDAKEPRSTEELQAEPGQFLEIKLQNGHQADDLERKNDGIRPAASNHEEDNSVTLALYIPDTARPLFQAVLDDYTSGPLTARGNPQKATFVEAIESIRQARLETFWTDSLAALPQDGETKIWWECWCYKDHAENFITAARTLECMVASDQYIMHYPEATIVPVYARRVEIELLLFANAGVSELRRASITPEFFVELGGDEQYAWAANLAERVTWPPNDTAAVCLLDTGVNRAHPLIEPALSPDNLDSINQAWGVDDHHGHGTAMAGLALHGDLTAQLADTSEVNLGHRLESVKLMPPENFSPNDPQSYGAITQTGVAIAELMEPDRERVFCMAITAPDVSGERASNWSSAIDQAAAGAMFGDEEEAPKRLFFISAGNVLEEIAHDLVREESEKPIEDPAQAWNAITVGGYTEKTLITELEFLDWNALADFGELSPHSLTSTNWQAGRMPYKPDIVMEAGNRAVSPDETEVVTLESLSLLTTSANVDKNPLRTSHATSAATAQAARIAAQISSAHPEYWPETIRALMIHSAQWTQAMKGALFNAPRKQDKSNLLKCFGYGVPSIDRALLSAKNDLALIAQSEIQPYVIEGRRKFNECHYYDLPWPRRVLENLGNTPVTIRVALSYFIEPSPGFTASINPQRYRSFGLRFDLKRRLEDEDGFRRRVNANEPNVGVNGGDDDGWLFGSNSVNAGSLHCDEWTGPAVQLASRDMLCIKPVNGWWRLRANAEVCNSNARYSLVVTLSSEDETIDLYTPIQQIVDVPINVEVDV